VFKKYFLQALLLEIAQGPGAQDNKLIKSNPGANNKNVGL